MTPMRRTDVNSIRKKVLKKVETASEQELDNILNYIEMMKKREARKKEILSYAGMWADMPQDFIDELTINLSKTRKSRKYSLK